MSNSNRKAQITVSGDLGSGKSTICRFLQTNLNYELFSMGQAWRELAAQYQITILELNKYSETHPLDEEMDQKLAAKGETVDQIIFDSRLGWHFVPTAFKVHLTVEPFVAASRICNDTGRGCTEGYQSIEEAIEKIQARKASEKQRYLQKYQLDYTNLANFDLIADTSYAPADVITSLIIESFQLWRAGNPFEKMLAPHRPS